MIDLNNINKKFITKEDILNKLQEADIYRFYTGQPVNLHGNTNSPLRKDKSPSFGYFIGKDGDLCFRDFVLGGGDVVRFVQLMFNLNYNEALSKIAVDFGIGEGFILADIAKSDKKPVIYNQKIEDIKERVSINKRSRKFESKDIAFWLDFNIDFNTLVRYNVEPIDYFFINNRPIKADPYAYSYQEVKDDVTYKIYQPFNKKYKWLNNHDDSVWQGWTQLPKEGSDLIITKSLKDVMSIVCTTGVPAVSLQAESVAPKSYVLEELKKRFTTIYVLYDNDFEAEENWGRKLGSKLAEDYNLHRIEIPSKYKSKDFSDLVKNIGKDEAKKILKKLILPF